jgi:DNA invertase Pin-like site-specific DNA recombinase
MGKRVALYARVSTTHGQSTDLQLDELRQVAKQRSWEVIGEYVDVGQSGSKDKRPELDRLQADVKRGKADIVATWKFDRYARSVRHLVLALEDYRARGIDFVALRDGIDTSTPGGRFTFHVIAAVAELEREQLRERTVAGLAAARRRGARIGRPKARVDEDRLLDLKAKGMSLREMARELKVSSATVHRLLKAADSQPSPEEVLEAA